MPHCWKAHVAAQLYNAQNACDSSNLLQISSNVWDAEESVSCFTLIVFLMSCDCFCSVALPRGAVGWYAVCDCGIPISYSFTFFSHADDMNLDLADSFVRKNIICGHFSYI